MREGLTLRNGEGYVQGRRGEDLRTKLGQLESLAEPSAPPYTPKVSPPTPWGKKATVTKLLTSDFVRAGHRWILYLITTPIAHSSLQTGVNRGYWRFPEIGKRNGDKLVKLGCFAAACGTEKKRSWGRHVALTVFYASLIKGKNESP